MSGFGGDGFKTTRTRALTIDRPHIPNSFSPLPTGPRAFSRRDRPALPSGPGDAPPGFVTAGTSVSEWIVYWALAKIFSSPKDPRRGPFNGSPDSTLWVYQKSYGRHQLVGARVDFVIYPYAVVPILIRLQTEFFHVYAGPKKRAYDRIQEIALGKYGRVADLFEQNFLFDTTGRAVILQVKDLIAGKNQMDPLTSGQAKRVRVRK